ncbi:MAG TPA: hypothetical protein PKY81_10485 [bacterium]|nr:hypothetical protein [bacterium]HPN31374.1 hypothetical protein [bacterium]
MTEQMNRVTDFSIESYIIIYKIEFSNAEIKQKYIDKEELFKYLLEECAANSILEFKKSYPYAYLTDNNYLININKIFHKKLEEVGLSYLKTALNDESLNISISEIRAKNLLNCEQCNQQFTDIKLIADPYIQDVNNKTELKYLCKNCYNILCDEI